MKREALVPIDEELDQQITRAAEPDPGPLARRRPMAVPRPRMNPDGVRQLTTHSYRGQLNDWLQRCDIRDEHGRRCT